MYREWIMPVSCNIRSLNENDSMTSYNTDQAVFHSCISDMYMPKESKIKIQLQRAGIPHLRNPFLKNVIK